MTEPKTTFRVTKEVWDRRWAEAYERPRCANEHCNRNATWSSRATGLIFCVVHARQVLAIAMGVEYHEWAKGYEKAREDDRERTECTMCHRPFPWYQLEPGSGRCDECAP